MFNCSLPKNIFTLLILGVSLSKASYSQNKLTYYVTQKGKVTDIPDSAVYVRIVSDADSDKGFYNIAEYYRNGKLKLAGKTSATDGAVLQGQCVSFYPTGKRQKIANYKNGRLYGDVYSYYPNGQLYAIKNYLGDDFTMIACNDSTGKILANEGTGHFIEYDPDLAFIREEGDITNGTKNGEWHGFFMDGPNKVTYTETYKDGDLMIGHSQKNGKQYIYASREVKPEYKGGEDKWREFVKSHLRYPEYAISARKYGQVFVQFFIEPDGTVKEAKVLVSPDAALSTEAIRVIELVKWIPGYRYGIPTRVKFGQSINFTSNNRQ